MSRKEPFAMARPRHPSFLKVITGTHRRPSTLDVITLCWDTDRLIKEVKHSHGLGKRPTVLDRVWSLIGISVTYLLTVAFSCLLLGVFYGLLAFGAVAALKFLVL